MNRHSYTPLDLGNLGAAIALASEALAAAAEALAEAAKAISAASDAFENIDHDKSSKNTTCAANVSGNSSSKREQTITGESKDSLGQATQHAAIDQQSMSRFDRGITITSTPPPSTPRSTVEIGPAHLSESHPPQFERKGGSSKLIVTPEYELNNKLDALPPSPITLAPNTPNMVFTRAEKSQASGPESNTSKLLEAMKSHPTIPPGRNCIYLDHPSDALAFIAFMALQVHRIICVVPNNGQGTYAELLKPLTHASIHCINGPWDYSNFLTALANASSVSYEILLTPCGNYQSNCGWMQESQPDCILHWTLPANVYSTTTRNVVENISGTVRACVMVVGDDSIDADMLGIALYSTSILERCFQPDSPFQILRRLSSQLLQATPVVPSAPHSSEQPPQSPLLQPPTCRIPTSSNSPRANAVTLPPGHYYIVMDQSNDIDVIPVIAYIALNTKKVVCHIPSSENVGRYHTFINAIANLNVITSTSKGKKLKAPTSRLKSEKSGILLRNVDTE
ncbi:unnamed protein product [Rhizoctonia solani]|uniref:Uncharacterized protein n=1 Tax=Rhizoctonia solani TaxID=456999 RepID=A0A8H3GUD2_9AGAM|nr:unnamed protein product [Rhizoctonia solani]